MSAWLNWESEKKVMQEKKVRWSTIHYNLEWVVRLIYCLFPVALHREQISLYKKKLEMGEVMESELVVINRSKQEDAEAKVWIINMMYSNRFLICFLFRFISLLTSRIRRKEWRTWRRDWLRCRNKVNAKEMIFMHLLNPFIRPSFLSTFLVLSSFVFLPNISDFFCRYYY